MLPLSANESPRSWSNWSGSVRFRPADLRYPSSEADVAALVNDAAASGRKVRVVGAGHSFTPLIETDGHLVSLDRMSGLISTDRAAREATAWAGTRLFDLGRLLHAEGLGQENLGDIDQQSIAGALATGTHGTGERFGVIATQAREITLVTGTGDVVTASAKENADVFKAAQVSLGALGVVTRVRLACDAAYKLELVRGKMGLDDVLDRTADLAGTNRNFEFFWFPHTDTVATKTMNVTNAPPTDRKVAKYVNDVILENRLFGAMSGLVRLAPALSRGAARLSAALVGTGREVAWSHRMYATPRLVRFQEMEYGVPRDRVAPVLRALRDLVRDRRVRVHFPVEVRFVRGDDAWLSPAHGGDRAFVAVHMYRGMPYQEYFDLCEQVFRENGGRPHWGKMHSRLAEDLRPLYPKWDAFRDVRRKLDPHGVFRTAYVARVLGE